jgi:hypothetical protein
MYFNLKLSKRIKMHSYQTSSQPKLWEARLLGRIEGCTNPESAELLADGETLVFGNCAMTLGHPAYRDGQGLVYIKGEAFISQARLSGSGSAELLHRHLVSGLTGALGIDVLPVATQRFPAGTAFIAEGGNPIAMRGASELVLYPAQLRARAYAFDPVTGAERGCIPLWQGSGVAEKFNPLDQPNGLAIDSQGNLYIGDIPNSNPRTTLPAPVDSAIYRIPHAALDALAAGDVGAAQVVERVVIPGFVNGVSISPIDDSCWIVSCSEHDPVNGGVYRLAREDFAGGVLPAPVACGLGILDGVGVTRRGTVLASNPMTGEIHALTAGGEHFMIRIGGDKIVRMPADFNVCYPTLLNGEPALLVPDISVGCPAGDGVVAIVDIAGL